MAAGPMDFTPGAMTNVNKKDFAVTWKEPDYPGEGNIAVFFSRPMALGSRAHQVAMFVVFESPLQMMCDSPTV